jgi:type II secretory pathway pseudopilin PulG
MQGKGSERGSVLLLEMLVVVSIIGVLLAISAPSFLRMQMSQQANQAISTLRAIENAETYYLQIYHNGYAASGVLAGTGIAVPATSMRLYFSGDHRRKVKLMATSFNSYPARILRFWEGGCTAPGSTISH